MTLVTGTMLDANGQPKNNAPVKISFPGRYPVYTHTDTAGKWQIDLAPTSGRELYILRRYQQNDAVFVVPETGGPYDINSLLYSPPSMTDIVEALHTSTPAVKGDTGSQGLQGVKGDQGVPGIQGSQGVPGQQGLTGPKGDTGEQGLVGQIGSQGQQGPIGNPGPKGDQGIQGVKGDTGAQGIQGNPGSTPTPYKYELVFPIPNISNISSLTYTSPKIPTVFDKSKFTGNPQILFRGTLVNTVALIGTPNARLYNMTTNTVVVGSDISVSNMAANATAIVESGDISAAMTNGSANYSVELRTSLATVIVSLYSPCIVVRYV